MPYKRTGVQDSSPRSGFKKGGYRSSLCTSWWKHRASANSGEMGLTPDSRRRAWRGEAAAPVDV